MRERKQNLKKVNLKDSIINVKNTLIYKWKEKHKSKYKHGRYRDLIDKGLLEILLTNIMDNSIKHLTQAPE